MSLYDPHEMLGASADADRAGAPSGLSRVAPSQAEPLIASPDFTVAELLEWARTKPDWERYCVYDAGHCALGQFGAATGRRHLLNCYDPDKELRFVGLNDALGFSSNDNTFGDLVKRLEALA